MRSTTRTLNFTNRIKIEQNRLQVVARGEGDRGFLEVHKLDLAGYEIADGSPVILEALTRRDGKLRLNLGTTPEPELVRQLKLHPEFFDSARVRIIVLSSDGSGRIVAAANDIDVDIPESAGLRSLLPTWKVDGLVHRLWRLRIDNNGYCIEINKNFPQIDSIIRGEKFRAIAMPDILRQIALSIADEGCEVPENIKNKWERTFQDAFPDTNDLKTEDREAWADEVAEAMSRRHSLLVAFTNTLGGDE